MSGDHHVWLQSGGSGMYNPTTTWKAQQAELWSKEGPRESSVLFWAYRIEGSQGCQ